MEVESWAFIGGFLGACIGIPGGFLGIEVIKLLASRAKRDPRAELYEWAVGQRGVKVFKETQIANRWVRTFDLSLMYEDDKYEEQESDESRARYDKVKLDCDYVTQVIGGPRNPKPIGSTTPQLASTNHDIAINQVRKELGLLP